MLSEKVGIVLAEFPYRPAGNAYELDAHLGGNSSVADPFDNILFA